MSAGEEHGGEHIVSPKLYILIWIILLIFTGITTGVAFLDLGVFNPIIALVIAVTKASLVVLFFMHVKYSSKMIALVIGCGLFFLSILMVLTTSDYISRAWSS